FYYYIAIDDIAKATQELETSRKMVNDDASLERFRDYLYSAEVRYYIVTKEHEKTLQTIDLLEKSYRKSGMLVSVNSTNLMRADTYWEMNDTEKAAAYYRLYLSEQEKEKAKNEEITTAEFATLLNMQKLTVEKAELEKLAQTKHLQNTRIIIVSLSVLLIIIFMFLYKQSILNKKLKRSRDKINVQNRQLYMAKEELSKAKEMAEESSRLKTLFIQNMSHEIRTPLNSIVGFSDVLTDLFADDENDDIRQFALLIEQNSQLLLKLIGDILELSNLDDNSEVVEYQLIGVNNCCQETLEKIKPLVNSNTTLYFLPAPDGFVLESNKKMVADVLENLLNNAAKFTQKGSITLACEKDDTKKACVFTVTDTGIGIPLDKQEYVFERFVKLDEFSQGTGLGLSISRLIAEKLGGTLVIDSEYKKGTRFIFTVPLKL
ncbi:HAMP domain-containing histidine kinase, partial [Bacteroides sp. OttesenSCG-928-E20]|nr:HAMP domain-containing histidine kinase [Bacteroides sp. OttesenSCG-928-E20]